MKQATARFGDGRSIIWLASYPKSGNTWLRSLLTAYCYPDDEFDINALIGQQDPFDRQLLDDHAGISSAEMSDRELIPYQAQLHRHLAQHAQPPYFIKTHSACRVSHDGTHLFPAEASAGAIYIVRDPVDVVPSLAHHEGRDFDWTIARMADAEAGLDIWPNKGGLMVPQFMSSWSVNAQSWLDQNQIPVHLLRYEDLHGDTERHFADVLRFCAIEIDQSRLLAAVERCRIDRLQSDETKSGFNERPSSERPFFRGGRIGDGHKKLSKEQKIEVREQHASAIEELGYRV
ncbi:sulfotransferase domain-containing protein [Pontixanthobacter gangjinensis]|uniref:Sulfotransferase domain-containing protein n=1 Tax=Pontixanthobacter gangjinensis TaxID=1028742 RepID=A0A6I4SPC1_9SPHN|nr:sulfotransferase domain-containing protein [Pontixanthobacter gangjinensis]MXO57604.1 hypothetical protein [Pontixanthobacter gangjinensis]